ncbi:MAG: hypothetical protein K6T55_06010 [Syntrophobacterales bacterium]|nr:hypothetical protein [Syntrophobacterales bacterium]
MTLTQAHFLRTWLGRFGALCCLLALGAVLDGIITKFREPFNVLAVLPGESPAINGPTAEQVKSPADLEWLADTPELTLTVEKVHSGYFLGGRMWQGTLKVGQGIAPGKHVLAVRPRPVDPAAPTEAVLYRINVYATDAARKAASLSLVERRLGLSPWWAALMPLPGILLTFGLIFLLSWRIEALMAAEGVSEIYRVTRKEGYLEVGFGLGTAHGVHPGDFLPVFDPEGRQTATVEVQEAGATDAVGRVGAGELVQPGFVVRAGRTLPGSHPAS